MRLIDADALMEDINGSINEMTNVGIMVDCDWLWAKLNDALDKAPTVEERKTGKWTMDGFCTVCGEEAITEWNDCGGELAFTKYCPNCGARIEE